LEYCRFLFVLHVANNATRGGSRYAVVNADKPVNFDAVDYTAGTGTTYPSIQSYTTARMGGTQKHLVGYQVAAFAVDSAGQALSPPILRPGRGVRLIPRSTPTPSIRTISTACRGTRRPSPRESR
jgi:hypothetical protein